ncbi:hypothetical protein ATI61_107511 [Archangium gephyra]|uniref:Uncharacterized protein n=1 Tax=Archangium gephyra TaxID=48 RepID=A0AAC8QJ55_9BACT|nr:hypothetical protein [Archangium gephyra]AKJ08076.1 Hypothetical protein AA314_09702 [Archangium gephyra]REG29814.1 hypothetical protein ATI61_107511 [Archangium gephyra]
MDRKKFALIKYDHGEPVSLSGARWGALALILGAAVGALFVFFPLVLALGFAAVVVARPPKRLYVGPRYLICGGKILYYANIQRVSMEAGGERLVLKSSTGRVLVLEQDRFQTGARKPDKIAANKAARFQKVAQKILKHVRRAAPHADLSDVRDGLLETGT